jgi:putative membrane protein insertion efficiency factor
MKIILAILNFPFQLIGLLFMGIIRLYQLTISPILPASCRYTPTCSQYSIEAIKKYGPFKGGYLAFRRILRCNPWGGHGHDPVP